MATTIKTSKSYSTLTIKKDTKGLEDRIVHSLEKRVRVILNGKVS